MVELTPVGVASDAASGAVLRVGAGSAGPGAHRVTFEVDGLPVWIDVLGHLVESTGDAALALGFLPALDQVRPLQIDLPVSPRLLAHIEELQWVFGTWRGRRPIDVDAHRDGTASRRSRGVGCFFSGGVDSFHSALRHRDELTHLVFVHGFDIALDDEALAQQALRHARAAANSLGLELIEVSTNLRQHPTLSRDWLFAHGPAAFAVAHTLVGVLGKVYVPASWTYADAHPQGTTP